MRYSRAGLSSLMALTLACAPMLSGCSAGDLLKSSGSSSRDQSIQTFAMGTVFSVRVISESQETSQSILSDTVSTIQDEDKLLSWREEGSLPDIFNKEHSADMSQISDLVEMTLDVSSRSGGALDPTILPISRLWNFDKMEDDSFDTSQMKVPDDADIQEALKNVGYEKLGYSQQTGMLTTEDENLQLELGAVGKGYAIDKALETAENAGASGILISAESSIGLQGNKEDGGSFNVALRDPRGQSTDDSIGVFHTTDCTISTSGDYERYFMQDGKRYHHILDPHTGYPADSGLMQVTIICSSGALGDALSTACFVEGLEQGMMLAKEYNVLAIFVDNDKNVWYNNSDVLDILEFSGEDSGYTLKEYTY